MTKQQILAPGASVTHGTAEIRVVIVSATLTANSAVKYDYQVPGTSLIGRLQDYRPLPETKYWELAK